MAPSRAAQRQRAVEPHGVPSANQVTAGEVAGREIVVAGHGDERPAEAPGHVLDEPGLAAAGRPFEHHGSRRAWQLLEHRDLVARGKIVGRLRPRIAYAALRRFAGWHGRSPIAEIHGRVMRQRPQPAAASPICALPRPMKKKSHRTARRRP